jgi:hypothetical protein
MAKITVWVVAWQYDGGAGFNFYWDKDDAEAAWVDEVKNTEDPQLKAEGWSAYFFPFDYELTEPDDGEDRAALTEAIVSEIDEDLDMSCVYADRKVENVLNLYGRVLSEIPRKELTGDELGLQRLDRE